MKPKPLHCLHMVACFCLVVPSIKGIPHDQRSAKADEILATVGLADASDTRCEDLSGGMKRKLSVGMALIGDSKIVFLVRGGS